MNNTVDLVKLDKNLSDQAEEIEVLNSVYGSNWVCDIESGGHSIQVGKNVVLYVVLHNDYPSDGPPTYELLAPCLDGPTKNRIDQEFKELYASTLGGPVIFQWIEKLKEIINQLDFEKKPHPDEISTISVTEQPIKDYKFPITHGSIVVDRKSVFQGHVAIVKSEDDCKEFLNKLLENKKIAQATHNISAYRLETPSGNILQDCDDDGECQASKGVLRLLQNLKLFNVMVVVTRWYGGVHLGPDRFRDINNAARLALVEGKFIHS